MKQLEWTTQQRKVNDLVPLEINPRKISEAKRMKMIESLQRFNLVDIPVIDNDGTIISGHQRLRALQAIGRGEEMIDVRVPNRKLTAKEVKEYNLLANTHFGEFDFDLLEVGFEDVDFNLVPIDLKKIEFEQSAGFEKTMDTFFKKQEAQKLNAEEDNYEEPAGLTTDIVTGDLFEIGPHRLMCGDSTNADDVGKLMGEEKADMVFTDPPYGVSIGAKNRMLNSFQKAGMNLTDIKDNSLSDKDLYSTLLLSFTILKQKLRESGSVYVCAPQGGNLGLMMMMMKDAGLEVKHVLNWVKNAPTFSMGRLDYEYQHEPILYTWNKNHVFYGNGEHKSSVWKVDKPRSNKEHPTMKPVKLVENAIMNSSKQDDNVLDIYLGSGTTMVASHQLGRRCFGMEIDPHYCQVIIDRMLKLDPALEVKRNGELYIPAKLVEDEIQ